MTTQIGPTAFVIFGGGGDLTWRKLIPALYNLWLDKWLVEPFKIFCVDGKPRRVAGLPAAPARRHRRVQPAGQG